MLRKRTMLVSQIEDGWGNDVNCKLLMHLDNNANNYAINGISGMEVFPDGSFVSGKFNQAYKGMDGLIDPIASYDGQLSNLLNENFTAEMWINTNSIMENYGNNLMRFGKNPDTGDSWLTFDISPITDTITYINISNLSYDEDYNETYTTLYYGSLYSNQLTEWTHIALVVNSGEIKVFINGQNLQFTGHVDYEFPIGLNCSFGSHSLIIDEIRFSNIARYTSDFTPPIAAYV